MTDACLSDETVFRFVQGKLGERDLAQVDGHLAGCADCRRVVAEASQFFGAQVGRYRIEEALGAGAAGFVYRAFDPQLQRRVALKLIAAAAEPSGSEAAQARLLHEARAMARLSHPNVVAVHDAGLFEDQVFVVMEMVEGATLARWLGERPRHWTEIVDAFVEAGRGLEAAHAAGLVHRDFKPENVLVGADGRVRVTDFGLAQPLDPSSGGTSEVAGTPAYMAPEQFLGREIDARTDQFSFCVALYTALHGQRPFGAASAATDTAAIQDLARDVVAGRLRPRPGATDVPLALDLALRRGLAPRPDDRHRSMAELLAAIGRVRADAGGGRRRRQLAAAVAALVALVGAGAGWRTLSVRCGNGRVDPGEECDDGNHDDGDGCTQRCLACRRDDVTFAWQGSGHCYVRHPEPLAWDDAREACARGGGDLVTYTSTAESNDVTAGLLPPAQPATWIGFRSAARERRTAWATGEAFSTTWSRWAAGEPRPPDAGARCGVESRPTGSNDARPVWATDDCGARHGFVCERAGWSSRPRGTHAYELFSRPVRWAEARDVCAAAGAHLATIADADEQAFVGALAIADVWLGATDAQLEGTFAWITGEPFQFRGFAPSEPDDRNGRDDCLALAVDKGWHDRNCAQSYAFVCERD